MRVTIQIYEIAYIHLFIYVCVCVYASRACLSIAPIPNCLRINLPFLRICLMHMPSCFIQSFKSETDTPFAGSVLGETSTLRGGPLVFFNDSDLDVPGVPISFALSLITERMHRLVYS